MKKYTTLRKAESLVFFTPSVFVGDLPVCPDFNTFDPFCGAIKEELGLIVVLGDNM